MVNVIDIKRVYDGWSKLSLATVRGDDGRVFDRLIEDHGNAVCVLPVDRTRKVALLVRQFRTPVNLATGAADFLEAIAGLTDGEAPQRAGMREAFEEAGVTLSAIEIVCEVWTMPGISTERMTLCVASYTKADRTNDGGGNPSEHESIVVQEMPLSELARLADAGALSDMKTFALVQTVRLRDPDLFT